MKEILDLAKECLNCKNPLCRQGCPINTKIPDFICQIKNNNLNKAYEILQENNVLSSICSKICPAENQCMGKCVKGIKEKPVEINILENHVNEWAEKNNVEYQINSPKNKNKKIAIIGSGPAGISCAYELIKKGYKITIFEKQEKMRRNLNIRDTRF